MISSLQWLISEITGRGSPFAMLKVATATAMTLTAGMALNRALRRG